MLMITNIKDSILLPAKQIHETFTNLMPSYSGQLSDEELASLIAYIRTLTKENLEKQKALAPKKEEVKVDESTLTPVQRGERLYKQVAVPSCATCHSIDGSRVVGPSFKGLYGRKSKFSDGFEIVADDAYIKDSVLKPRYAYC